MNELPVIPTPPSVRWADARVRWVPVLVFFIVGGAVLMLWQTIAMSPTLSGVGEGLRSLISSPQPAVLQRILVEPYQVVNKGDPIAVISPADPRIQFDLFRSELEIARIRLQPSIAEGNAMNYERVRVELLRTKSELAVAKEKLALAERDLQRNTPLFHEKLVSEAIYDLSLKTRDMHKVEVEEKTKAVMEIEKWLEDLSGLGDPLSARASEAQSSLLAELQRAYVSAATNLAPITLVAPITGMVGQIQRQPGEYVVAGEPLIIINSLWSDRVVGYLRQPYRIDPEVGMPVLVTTRTHQHEKFWTQIAQVGTHIEIITNSLAYLKMGAVVDEGLPIVVDLPPNAKIRSGEIVDLLIRPKPGSTDPAVNLEGSAPRSGNVTPL